MLLYECNNLFKVGYIMDIIEIWNSLTNNQKEKIKVAILNKTNSDKKILKFIEYLDSFDSKSSGKTIELDLIYEGLEDIFKNCISIYTNVTNNDITKDENKGKKKVKVNSYSDLVTLLKSINKGNYNDIEVLFSAKIASMNELNAILDKHSLFFPCHLSLIKDKRFISKQLVENIINEYGLENNIKKIGYEEVKTLSEMLNSFAEMIPKDATILEKVIYIVSIIKEYFTIDKNSMKNSTIINFLSGKGVCEDISQLISFLCTYLGIENEIIRGYVRTDEGKQIAHAWVKILSDEKEWYNLDVTKSNDIRNIVLFSGINRIFKSDKTLYNLGYTIFKPQENWNKFHPAKKDISEDDLYGMYKRILKWRRQNIIKGINKNYTNIKYSGSIKKWRNSIRKALAIDENEYLNFIMSQGILFKPKNLERLMEIFTLVSDENEK